MPAKSAIGAPWGLDADLRDAINALRTQGEVVIQLPVGVAHEEDEFICDRELVKDAGQWVVQVKAC